MSEPVSHSVIQLNEWFNESESQEISMTKYQANTDNVDIITKVLLR